MMMTTDFNDSIAHNMSSVIDFDHKNKMKDVANKENENNDIKPSISPSKLRPNKKKSVRFDDTKGSNITYTINAIVRASEMSSKEKQVAWYNCNEFDQFKYEAARHAGIEIVRYDNTTEERTNQSHRFAMVGNFDDCSTDKDAASTSNNTSNIEPTSSLTGKAATVKNFYNENEYNDTHTSKGKSICKRGLGYHFSRNRKKSRAVTRSAVVTWQKMLLSGNNTSSLSSSSKPKSRRNNLSTLSETNNITGRKLVIGKMQLMLSLVSAKCSRVAREEARWRGDVDYMVAYPEHKRDDAAAANCNRDGTIAYKKRPCDNSKDDTGDDDAGVISCGKNARCKRRRTSSSSGDCREVGNDAKLSRTTPIGYIDGILRTEL